MKKIVSLTLVLFGLSAVSTYAAKKWTDTVINETPFEADFSVSYGIQTKDGTHSFTSQKSQHLTLKPGETRTFSSERRVNGVYATVKTRNILPAWTPTNWIDPQANVVVPLRAVSFRSTKGVGKTWRLKGPSFGQGENEQLYLYEKYIKNPNAKVISYWGRDLNPQTNAYITSRWNALKMREIASQTGGAVADARGTGTLYLYKAGQITNPAQGTFDSKERASMTFKIW